MDQRKPTLLLDEGRARNNIKVMAERAAKSKVRFRPHFKTHQSAEIGEWFREIGVEAITVSSLSMARYFAQHGWQDITVAFPTNILEIDTINELASQVKLGVLVEAEQTVKILSEQVTSPLDVWIEVDVGYGRSGVDWTDADMLDALATQLSDAEQLTLRGALTHAGHAYTARTKSDIRITYQDMVFKMKAARSRLKMAGVEEIEISIGDTPTCSVVNNLSDVDEIRPGNFVFYDIMQLQIGACDEEQIATAMACPVVAKYPEQNRIILYGGAVHLAKEAIIENGQNIFGYIALPQENGGWGFRVGGAYLTGLSQEHGIVTAGPQLMSQVNIGDILIVLPVHACLTANLMRKYQTLDGQIIPLGDLNEA